MYRIGGAAPSLYAVIRARTGRGFCCAAAELGTMQWAPHTMAAADLRRGALAADEMNLRFWNSLQGRGSTVRPALRQHTAKGPALPPGLRWTSPVTMRSGSLQVVAILTCRLLFSFSNCPERLRPFGIVF